ncbi:repetitive proline-rich cell wall protein 2-like [Neltuma alba]|uniref:repetitive proline-rich cell wall protein 2-like n=1 Tax=Neltuma alba TaxID=207710 RepID=UPI0010A58E26|nr:repetitive proline-rich cell wall protein 2-like [Prosopis alba]
MSSKHFLVFLFGVVFLTTSSSFTNSYKPPVSENIPPFGDSSADDIPTVEEEPAPIKKAPPIYKITIEKPPVYKLPEKPIIYESLITKESMIIKPNKPNLPPPPPRPRPIPISKPPTR